MNHEIAVSVSAASTIMLAVTILALIVAGNVLVQWREVRKELKVLRRLSRWRGAALAATREREAELRGRLTPTTKRPRTAPRAPTLVPTLVHMPEIKQ